MQLYPSGDRLGGKLSDEEKGSTMVNNSTNNDKREQRQGIILIA